ncbi:Glyoxal oxidase [Macleaya cordata]|uniref:Glyoxal oxidase n=1 Tax=Macleaya cordata TaxID=56857 RepID=A0A200QYG9_MACCD|nr:Glyoxal oxidase [Macleaya cordata]
MHESIGISAMHMQVLHNNKVVMFDRTDFGPSNLSLPNGRCRYDSSDTALKTDCTAHALLYDIATSTIRPLMVQTDTWCSSGAVLPDGVLVQTGGYNDGDRTIRTLAPCNDDNCDWVEYPNYLSVRRWYATNQILPDGRIIIVGGRRQFSYEFYPRNGNLFIFANTRSISLDYVNNRVVREYPNIKNADPRNYPSSGSSVLLPLHISSDDPTKVEAEILICGGAPQGSFARAGRNDFVQATSTCGRLKVTDPNPNWIMEDMPMARVMGDMLILPTGDIIILNGAGSGTAGWHFGRGPVTEPVIYKTDGQANQRFSMMNPADRPRMYHSAAVLVPDGRILVGGSNPNQYYNFTGVLFPTELSLVAFSPPYLAPENVVNRPFVRSAGDILPYGKSMNVLFTVTKFLGADEISVRILSPSFTTHSLGMNQRMVVLRVTSVSKYLWSGTYQVDVVGPPTSEIAPPGYYMMFVVHAGVPSPGVWVKIQ